MSHGLISYWICLVCICWLCL